MQDGWGVTENSVLAHARAAGQDDPVVHVFIPRAHADELARLIATRSAATETVDYKGVPTTEEGIEARSGMETRATEAENNLRALAGQIVESAKVIQGGGNERLEAHLPEKVKAAARSIRGAPLSRVPRRRRQPLANRHRTRPRRRGEPFGCGGLRGQDRGTRRVRGGSRLHRFPGAKAGKCALTSLCRPTVGRGMPWTRR